MVVVWYVLRCLHKPFLLYLFNYNNKKASSKIERMSSVAELQLSNASLDIIVIIIHFNIKQKVMSSWKGHKVQG